MRFSLTQALTLTAILGVALTLLHRSPDVTGPFAASPRTTVPQSVQADSPEPSRVTATASIPAEPPAPPRVSLSDPRVSIQTAAQRLCAQAGMVYDFTRSRANADPDCRRYVAVNISDATLEDALDQVVAANGLRWKMKDRSVWLERQSLDLR